MQHLHFINLYKRKKARHDKKLTFWTYEKNQHCKGSGEKSRRKPSATPFFRSCQETHQFRNMVVSEGHVLGLWVFSSVFKFSVMNSKSF